MVLLIKKQENEHNLTLRLIYRTITNSLLGISLNGMYTSIYILKKTIQLSLLPWSPKMDLKSVEEMLDSQLESWEALSIELVNHWQLL